MSLKNKLPAKLGPIMRLKRKMSEAEFAEALRFIRPMQDSIVEIAHADLVKCVKQDQIASQYGISKAAVSQASRRVFIGFLKSKGYEEISVVLPSARAHQVKLWSKEALTEINDSKK